MENSNAPEFTLQRSMSEIQLSKKRGSGLRFRLGVPTISSLEDSSSSDTDSLENGMFESLRARGSITSSASNRSSFIAPSVRVETNMEKPWEEIGDGDDDRHFAFGTYQAGLGNALSPRNVEREIRRYPRNVPFFYKKKHGIPYGWFIMQTWSGKQKSQHANRD